MASQFAQAILYESPVDEDIPAKEIDDFQDQIIAQFPSGGLMP